MKKLLLALLVITGFGAFAPKAEAGQYARVYTDCGVAYVPKAALYGRSYTDRVAYDNYRGYSHSRSHYRSHSRHHSRRSYHAPRYSRPSSYYRNHDRNYRAPRIALSFGF